LLVSLQIRLVVAHPDVPFIEDIKGHPDADVGDFGSLPERDLAVAILTDCGVDSLRLDPLFERPRDRRRPIPLSGLPNVFESLVEHGPKVGLV